MSKTYFLKLGGSLITDKDHAQTAIIPQIDQIAGQIKQFVLTNPEIHLLVGHGSGSFGHVAASKYHTREGVFSPEQWLGLSQVWFAARTLNQIVIERFNRIDLPVISFPLSASAMTLNGKTAEWNSCPIATALEHHLLPMIYGDIVFDETLGGTILSTEDQFALLMPQLRPEKIFLAGREEGVWQDYPACTRLIRTITPATYSAQERNIYGSASVDVTGGMASKVSGMLNLIRKYSSLQVQIFSGSGEGSILQALTGDEMGTILRSDQTGGK